MSHEISARCAAVEEVYEFMLAYAGQGLAGDEGSQSSGQAREYLNRAADAVSGLTEAYTAAVREGKFEQPETYQSFRDVLEGDARNTLAAIRLVLAQPFLSSQLIDNLNASIHVRALLTDLFLVDEILKVRRLAQKESS